MDMHYLSFDKARVSWENKHDLAVVQTIMARSKKGFASTWIVLPTLVMPGMVHRRQYGHVTPKSFRCVLSTLLELVYWHIQPENRVLRQFRSWIYGQCSHHHSGVADITC